MSTSTTKRGKKRGKSTNGFVKLPRAVIARTDLGPPAMIILAVLTNLAEMERQAAHTAREVADHAVWDLRRTQYALRQLVQVGDVETLIDPNDKRVTLYRVCEKSVVEVHETSVVNTDGISTTEVSQKSATEMVGVRDRSVAEREEVSLFPVVKNPPGEEERATARETTSPLRGGHGVREGGPGAAVEEARRLLRDGYAERFRRETGDGWQGSSGNRGYIDDVAAYVVETGRGDLAGRVRAILDGYFGGRPDLARLRWPWKYLAEDPGRYAGAAADASRTQALEAIYAEIDAVKAKISVAVGERRLDDIPPLEAELERIKARGRALRDGPRKAPAAHGGRRVAAEPTGTREAFAALRGRAS
ncbi:MAG: hypothetical protein KC619_24040 [Myxococcales bacterium]|nr:hypothetical protein [Myxococcales bacterium]